VNISVLLMAFPFISDLHIHQWCYIMTVHNCNLPHKPICNVDFYFSGQVHTATQFCCNGVACNLTSDLKCCGPVGVFDQTIQKCCKSGKHYSLFNLSDAKNHGQCCGSQEKVKSFDARIDQCCGGMYHVDICF
jgi:hypothetical protein